MSVGKHIVFLGLLFFFIRLINLTSLPIFNDESIQLHWGNILVQSFPEFGDIPLTLDGKQAGVPLVYGLVQKIPGDPLFSARLFNVLFSLVTFISTVAIAQKMRLSIFPVGFLLAFSPYLLFFDRLALADSIIAALYTACILMMLQFMERPGMWKSVLLGVSVAAGWWMKSTILLVIPIIIFGFFLSFFRSSRGKLLIAGSLVTFITIFILCIAPLYFHEDYQNSPLKDIQRIVSMGELLQTSPEVWVSHLVSIIQWLVNLGTPFVCIAFLLGLWSTKLQKSDMLLLVSIFLPILFEIFFLRTISSRYLVLIMPIILIIASRGISRISRFQHAYTYLTIFVCAIFSLVLLFFPLSFYRYFLFFSSAKSDFSQYFIGWPSGYGVKDAVDWILQDAGGQDAVVLLRGDSGNPEDAMYVYLYRYDNMLVTTLDMQQVVQNAGFKRFYFVSRGAQYAGMENQMRELIRFKKPLDDEFVGVYEAL